MAITNVALVKRVDSKIVDTTVKFKHGTHSVDATNKLDAQNEAVIKTDNNIQITTASGKQLVIKLTVTLDTSIVESKSYLNKYIYITSDVGVAYGYVYAIVDNGDGTSTLQIAQQELSANFITTYGKSLILNRPLDSAAIHAKLTLVDDLIPPLNSDINTLRSYTFRFGENLYILNPESKLYLDGVPTGTSYKKGDLVTRISANGAISFYRANTDINLLTSGHLLKLQKGENGSYTYEYKIQIGASTLYVSYTMIKSDDGSYKVRYTSLYNTTNFTDVNFHMLENLQDIRLSNAIDADGTQVEIKHLDIFYYDGDYYILLTKGLQPSEFLFEDINDTNLFTKLDDNYGWNYVGKANAYRMLDSTLDTYMETDEDAQTTIEVNTDCEYDFVAVRNAKSDTFEIDILDENGNVVENKIDVGLAGDVVKTANFYKCCPTVERNKCDDTSTDYIFNLDKTYNNKNKIVVKTKGYARAGSVFIGKNIQLPCVEADINVNYRSPRQADTNELSGTIEMISAQGLVLKETSIAVVMRSHKDAQRWTPIISSFLNYYTYVNFKFDYMDEFTGDLSQQYAFLSHAGYMTDMKLHEEMRRISFIIKEYNNG